jgi:sulfate adenylyltransferase
LAEDTLVRPHGGTLVDLLVDRARADALQAASHQWPSWSLTARQLCDLEMLLTGAFSPLTGFLSRRDYQPVCSTMRTADGTLWPIPVTLDVPESFATIVASGSSVALRDPEGVMLAALHVDDVWAPDRDAEADAVFGTRDRRHPGVAAIADVQARWAVGGSVEGVRLPVHYDFESLRLTPAALRAQFRRMRLDRVVAFQTRNPMHRAHRELTLRAAERADAHLLLHPIAGMSKPGDVDHYTRVRCYQRLLSTYPPNLVTLALAPLAMRMAGPREALWHAIIRKNYGCTHFIVGRDHAGPGSDAAGRPFYPPYAAQELVRAHQHELGITMVPFRELRYLADEDRYVPDDQVPPGSRVLDLSGTALRELLANGEPIPGWFTFPEIAAELQRTHRPRPAQGITVFFTGLSGAGKSTIANVLRVKLLELGTRPVTLLDGDVVRTHLSSELGFSKAHRDLNIRRIGFVASQITRNGGAAICAPIAPYDAARREARELIEREGGFVLVYVSTPLAVCEQRDRKGLYAKARAGVVAQFTGISDPYEVPADADLTFDTTELSAVDAADRILAYLAKRRYISG